MHHRWCHFEGHNLASKWSISCTSYSFWSWKGVEMAKLAWSGKGMGILSLHISRNMHMHCLKRESSSIDTWLWWKVIFSSNKITEDVRNAAWFCGKDVDLNLHNSCCKPVFTHVFASFWILATVTYCQNGHESLHEY